MEEEAARDHEDVEVGAGMLQVVLFVFLRREAVQFSLSWQSNSLISVGLALI